MKKALATWYLISLWIAALALLCHMTFDVVSGAIAHPDLAMQVGADLLGLGLVLRGFVWAMNTLYPDKPADQSK